jgi:hypothetical protein
MRWIWMSVSVVGLAVIAVGLLWFLQGSDLVHIDPIACAANCEPIVGYRPAWQVAGAVAVLTGALATTLAVRKVRR